MSDAGQQAVRSRVTILHCTTEYPAPMSEVNLRAVDTIAAAFGARTGYSDHTPGIHIPIAAVARVATRGLLPDLNLIFGRIDRQLGPAQELPVPGGRGLVGVVAASQHFVVSPTAGGTHPADGSLRGIAKRRHGQLHDPCLAIFVRADRLTKLGGEDDRWQL